MNDEGARQSPAATIPTASIEGISAERAPRPGESAEWCSNPRWKLRCECGSGRPSVFLIITGDGDKLPCCYACLREMWARERLF